MIEDSRFNTLFLLFWGKREILLGETEGATEKLLGRITTGRKNHIR